MNRAGFRAIRIGRLSALVRPRALACLMLLALVALSLLGFGLTHGSLPVPTSAIGRALFSPESLTAETRYIVMDIRLPRLLMGVAAGAGWGGVVDARCRGGDLFDVCSRLKAAAYLLSGD